MNVEQPLSPFKTFSGGSKMAAESLEAPSTCSQTWTSLAAKPQSNQLKNPT